jgi:hypothetical protein
MRRCLVYANLASPGLESDCGCCAGAWAAVAAGAGFAVAAGAAVASVAGCQRSSLGTPSSRRRRRSRDLSRLRERSWLRLPRLLLSSLPFSEWLLR